MRNILITTISLICLLFCVVPAVFSQGNQIQISGTVTDENNETMIGVAIYVKNETGLGTTTDINGNYKITAGRNSTLVFSFIGYDRQEVEVEGRTRIDVKMSNTESSVLDEVVITGLELKEKHPFQVQLLQLM